MYYSQDYQDSFLEEKIFKGFENGTFVDVGAYDGEKFSNSLFFEKYRNWNGICIEPIPEIYEKLKNKRKCITYKCAIDNKDGTNSFLLNVGYPEMLSGIQQYYDPRHFNRLNIEINNNGGKTSIIDVETKKLSTILEEQSINHVHYLSIDVEGGEFAVIQSIDFSKVFIDVIGFENNYNDISIPIVNYLKDKGYIQLNNDKWCLDIFMIHKNSDFYVE
uniref:Methyltransferase FkbM domain-containing protein n=1 Tax=viral metagenome TaxID=1070528 RepID=A0A6C0LUC4_9ZZZZ